MINLFVALRRKFRSCQRKTGRSIYQRLVHISGYIITTLYFQAMFLRGRVGIGPKVLNGKWVDLNVTFTAWSLVVILLLVEMVNAGGLSVKGLIAGLSMNIIFSNVKARVKIVYT